MTTHLSHLACTFIFSCFDLIFTVNKIRYVHILRRVYFILLSPLRANQPKANMPWLPADGFERKCSGLPIPGN